LRLFVFNTDYLFLENQEKDNLFLFFLNKNNLKKYLKIS